MNLNTKGDAFRASFFVVAPSTRLYEPVTLFSSKNSKTAVLRVILAKASADPIALYRRFCVNVTYQYHTVKVHKPSLTPHIFCA